MFVNKHQEAVIKDAISLEEKVAFLQLPASYPFPVSEVTVKETHMSWIFLVDDFVYKLKKPVSYSLFDHRSLQSRWKNSQEEFYINKQLAKDIYLAVLPLVINEKGMLQIDGEGEVTDWLVKMKRIPDGNMLDYAIQHQNINEKQLMQAAVLLAEFYKTAPPYPITLASYSDKLESQISFNYNQLTNPLFGLSRTLIEELTAGQRAFVLARQPMFEKRIAGKKIIDAHGDLRPEHICLGPPVAIIDRLEFSKDLRIVDVAEELSFLSMECEIIGDKHAGQVFLDVYSKLTNDHIPGPLMNFYKIKKACLRAYLVARHIEEPHYQHDPKWLTKANAYLQLAENYHQQLAT
jgi:aminoglycoside phosphotransferase family enzyme